MSDATSVRILEHNTQSASHWHFNWINITVQLHFSQNWHDENRQFKD